MPLNVIWVWGSELADPGSGYTLTAGDWATAPPAATSDTNTTATSDANTAVSSDANAVTSATAPALLLDPFGCPETSCKL